MKIEIARETLLKPLLHVTGVIERRQSLPILSNVLVRLTDQTLTMTGTDLEIELVAQCSVKSGEAGDITLPARKFADICRALPDNAEIVLDVDGEKAKIRSGRSRFTLSTLPAAEFPALEKIDSPVTFAVPQNQLKRLIERTQFAMAQQDVRYYLNGMMLELDKHDIRAVATDGHRLATSELSSDTDFGEIRQVIVPRKGVSELMRLLQDSETDAEFQLGSNHVRVKIDDVIFSSKLIDGKFPDYRRVIPENADIKMICDREGLRQAFQRASVLSNEKYRGMRLQLQKNLLTATVHNPEQEEAEEEIEVSYEGPEFEIGFNVAYFLDALNAIRNDRVQINLTDANSSCLVHGVDETDSKYVIMPMRL